MKSIIRLIGLNGGFAALKDRRIRVEKEGFDRLCVEHVGPAPTPGLELVSVAHYFEQNGDLMADPEMTFEVNPADWQGGHWRPASITQAPVGVYREAIFRDAEGRVLVRPGLVRELRSFARMWDRNIRAQGYLDAFRRQLALNQASPQTS